MDRDAHIVKGHLHQSARYRWRAQFREGVVVLPILAPFLLSKTVVERISHSVCPVKVLALGVLLLYMKFAKNTFAPVVMNWLADLVG